MRKFLLFCISLFLLLSFTYTYGEDLKGIKLSPLKIYPKLESALAQLIVAWREGRLAQFAVTRAIAVLPEEKIRVIIVSRPGSEKDVMDALESLGGEAELSHGNLLQALVPIPVLPNLVEHPAVKKVRLPIPFTLLVESEGVGLIGASDWHDQGYTGAGVKVGILDGGFAGYEDLLGSELPSTVDTWWAPSIGGPGSSPHGTGCAEIVYDMAPDATFYLANFSTGVEWADAIDWLISQGVQVISHSMGWLNTAGPGDGTGWFCEQVSRAKDAGILWAQAAGNGAKRHWSGNWVDTDTDGWLEFYSGDETNEIYADAGDRITIGLRWNDPWGASSNDYDLYLFDSDLNEVARSDNPQDGDDDPTESIVYDVSISGTYHIAIHRYSADGAASFDLETFHHDLEYQVAAGSLTIPADSPDAMTIGAVPWYDPDTLEDFSSQGPTTDGRTKPDLVGPDGVSNYTYGNFYGTSAATPHGAGAAVLVKDRFPTYTPAQIQAYLEANAIDLGIPGKDNQYGSGRLYLPPPLVFRVERETGDVHAAGAYYGSDFVSGSADVAEWVPVTEPVEPGDVLEIDPENPGYYRKARVPCSNLVAGVVSTEPGFVLGHGEDTEGKVLLALMGIVPVKVTDEGGPIRPGDLLVVSSTPGYAMRWDPDSGLCGFVGKALEPWEEGEGVILVLLMR